MAFLKELLREAVTESSSKKLVDLLRMWRMVGCFTKCHGQCMACACHCCGYRIFYTVVVVCVVVFFIITAVVIVIVAVTVDDITPPPAGT